MAKRKIEKVNTSDIIENEDLIIKTNNKEVKSKGGRPKKFKEEMSKKIDLLLTKGQYEAIEKKMSSIGITVKTDYVRSLLCKEIPNFMEL